MAFNKREKTVKERAATTHYFLGWPPWTRLIKPAPSCLEFEATQTLKEPIKTPRVSVWLSPVSDKMTIVGLWDKAMSEKKEKNTTLERNLRDGWHRCHWLHVSLSVVWMFFEPETRTRGGTLQHRFNLARRLCGSGVGGYIYIKWSY